MQFVLGDDDVEDEDKEVEEEDDEPADRGLMTCADICFINLIRSAIMALQLFPENSAGGWLFNFIGQYIEPIRNQPVSALSMMFRL